MTAKSIQAYGLDLWSETKMKRRTVVINGVTYTANPKKKQAQNPMAALDSFMQKQGYEQVGKEDASYTRKDGKTIPVKAVDYSNGKRYFVSHSRFWKC